MITGMIKIVTDDGCLYYKTIEPKSNLQPNKDWLNWKYILKQKIWDR